MSAIQLHTKLPGSLIALVISDEELEEGLDVMEAAIVAALS